MPESMIVHIAGIYYRNRGEVETALTRLDHGSPLVLKREPHNPHDDLAVAVFAGGSKLGYIPRSSNMEVAWSLDKGLTVRASYVVTDDGVPSVEVRWV
jgi:hypothetical protein